MMSCVSSRNTASNSGLIRSAGAATGGVAQVGIQTGVPCIFGVVTTENIEQAIERAGTKAGNKGFDAAVAAIEMARLLRQITVE